MKKDLTELVFIIDKSGSMSGLEADTIGGFNSLIAKQKRQSGECFVNTVLFNSECEVLHDRVKLGRVEPLTANDYTVSGCTALLDAVGGAIKHIVNIHRYSRREDIPEHTVFVITTDGMENASRKYTANEVRRMIKYQQERYGWEFIFLGANIDAENTAKDYGIAADRAVNYCCDEVGTAKNYEAMHMAIGSIRRGEKLTNEWRRKVDEDYRGRRGNR